MWPLVRNTTANSKGGTLICCGSVNFVPWLLTKKQKQMVCVCVSWDEARNDQKSLVRVITRDKLGLLLQTSNQTEVLSLENATLSISKEIKANQVKHQKHVGDPVHYWEVLQYLMVKD